VRVLELETTSHIAFYRIFAGGVAFVHGGAVLDVRVREEPGVVPNDTSGK
jgi:hypothetical protein